MFDIFQFCNIFFETLFTYVSWGIGGGGGGQVFRGA